MGLSDAVHAQVMNNVDPKRAELLDILANIRAHLEFQQALGVKTLDVGQAITGPAPAPAAALPKASAAPAAPKRTASAAPVPAAPVTEPEAIRTTFSTLEEVREEIGDCRRCKLHKGRTTIVFGEGSATASLVFVGEGPGFEEDQQGRPFVGAAGQLLTDIIEKGMKLKRADVYICNIVKCRPPGNRNPEPDEVDACIGFVKQQIAVIRPKVIVTLGNVPTQNLLGTKQGITKLRGTWQEYNGIPVMPTFHPSYLLRSPSEKKWVWADIQQVLKKLGMAIPSKE
jgi:DNA polymerase